MTSTHDGHGHIFVGVYLELLVRYLRLERGSLEASFKERA